VKNQAAATVLREISPARIFARPTADELWLGPAQESALSQLSLPTPIRVLLGPHSSGRSTLLRHLAQQTESFTILAVAGPQRRKTAVLKALLRCAGMAADSLDGDEMRRVLDLFLRERFARGQRVIVAVDDAESFGPAAFAEIARLAESGAATAPAPELLLCLVHIDEGSSPAAEFLRAQTAPALCVVSWMSNRELGWYLNWRLGRFGLAGVFSPSAIRLIARCTHGSFSAVDHLCQLALLLLRRHAEDQVDVRLVREAMRELKRRRRSPGAQPDRQSSGQLLISRDGDVVGQIALRDKLLIGRSELNDLCLDSDYLSRYHALIRKSGTRFSISDLNSENGVLLNGEAVSAALINDGDIIRIGSFRIKVELADRLPRAGDEAVDQLLASTSVMPAIDGAGPANLRVVR
jgi:general secretion pathway protein A